MRLILINLGVLALSFQLSAQSVVLLQENFTNYLGTSSTVPAGWYCSYNGNYTSGAFSGASGPNSYKFGVNSGTVVTAAFANADSVSFWIKGASTDSASYLLVYETSDSITWDTIAQIKPVPKSGTACKFPVNNTSIHLKFFYFKSVGNLAFDDFKATKYAPYISSGDIKIYFTHPVNTSVSGGVNAVYLNQTLDDTLIACINRAKYTIDVAMYNYVQTTNFSNIANAINNAYNKGVKVRWIYNGSSSNIGVSLLDAGIKTLASPTLSNYGIMHHKFMITDAKSSDAKDAFVWTGSCNWMEDQFNNDANNALIMQDKYLALAFTNEFEEMWGDTGLIPNTANSKFGPYKTNDTQHNFTIGGKAVELYFSPSDNTNEKILASISGANKDLYFGMYAFTLDANADSIKNKISNGVYTAGIVDPFSQSYSAYPILQSAMGNNLKTYSAGSALYHNKFLIADACDAFSDPLVLTGSHNWTSSADTKNDENTLIIHDDTIANIYYQSFYQNFLDLGAALAPCSVLNAPEISENDFIIFPNPTSGKVNLKINRLENLKIERIEIYNLIGKRVYSHSQIDSFSNLPAGQAGFQINLTSQPNGFYFLNTIIGGKHFTSKIIVQR